MSSTIKPVSSQVSRTAPSPGVSHGSIKPPGSTQILSVGMKPQKYSSLLVVQRHGSRRQHEQIVSDFFAQLTKVTRQRHRAKIVRWELRIGKSVGTRRLTNPLISVEIRSSVKLVASDHRSLTCNAPRERPEIATISSNLDRHGRKRFGLTCHSPGLRRSRILGAVSMRISVRN